MTIKKHILEQLTDIIKTLGLSDITIQIDYPTDPKHGDYASNVALIAAKQVGKNPIDLAEEIKTLFEKQKPFWLKKIDVVKPGFLNFWITEETLIQNMFVIDGEEKQFPDIGKGQTIIVEYSSPNIAKPFTIGHLRSTIIGDAIANLLVAVGYTIHRDNHVGDWGTQFGKQICAIKRWGNEDNIEKSERPVKKLVALYVRFHKEAEKNPALEDEAREWFKKLEEGDEEARRLWQKCIDWSWKEFNAIYEQLGVSFTENNGRGYGESFFEDKMKDIVQELEEKKLLKEGKEGARIVEFAEETKLPPLMILKKDGATLYATRDLATDKFRQNQYGKDLKIINEVGAEQALYFQQLFQLEAMLGWYRKDERVHIKHGLYRFKEGKMSTRKGNVIWLEDVLEEAIKRAYRLAAVSGEQHGEFLDAANKDLGEIIEKQMKRDQRLMSQEKQQQVKQIGIGALKWNDLKRDPKQDIVFDWDEMLNMQGNSGPYLQYVYARTQSVLRKVPNAKLQLSNKKLKDHWSFITGHLSLQAEERDLLRLLSRFPEIVEEAASRYAPLVLCTYLFELAQVFNLFYQKHQILKEQEQTRSFRLSLTTATGAVIKRGLTLLGIQAPEYM